MKTGDILYNNGQGRRPNHNRWVVPAALTVLGASVIILGLVIAREQKEWLDDEDHDVENYDIVKDKPFIYGLAE